MKFPALTDSSFHEWSLCSMWWCLMAFYPQENFQSWSQSSQTLLLLYQLSLCYSKSFVVISTLFTASSPGVRSISRNHFPCWSVRSNSSSTQVLSRDCRIQSHLQTPLVILVVSLFLLHLQLLTRLEFWTPHSHTWLESTSSNLPLMLIFWPLLMNHEFS